MFGPRKGEILAMTQDARRIRWIFANLIWRAQVAQARPGGRTPSVGQIGAIPLSAHSCRIGAERAAASGAKTSGRQEEDTSELQSTKRRQDDVFFWKKRKQ